MLITLFKIVTLHGTVCETVTNRSDINSSQIGVIVLNMSAVKPNHLPVFIVFRHIGVSANFYEFAVFLI